MATNTRQPTPRARQRSKLPPPTKKVYRWEDVPAFDNEDDEHRFWAEHELAGEALESMGRDTLDDELPVPRERK